MTTTTLNPTKYIITQSRATEFPNPLMLQKGQLVELGQLSQSENWQNWIWCITETNTGWAPIQIFEKTDETHGIVLEDYNARELDVQTGEGFISEKALNGWHYGFLEKSPQILGWVPVENAAIQPVSVSLYVRALDIAPLHGDITPFIQQFENFYASVAFDKVYIETHRDMVIPDKETLLNIKNYLSQKGIETSAGITVTVNEMDDFKTYCYSNPEHREKIKGFVTYTANLFDEVLFDDFFFTNCKCPLCIEQKGEESWTEFRLKQMTEASKTLVLEPARRANPKVKVMIKYPNWYEHFQGSGFNLKDQPPLYDGIYTGNETRDAYFSTQHLQAYQSYQVFRYYENIKPNGNKGGWVDPFGATYMERYAQQIWMTLFAKAKELTLFDYHAISTPLKESQKGDWQNESSEFSFEAMYAKNNEDNRNSNNSQSIQQVPTQMVTVAARALAYVAPILPALGNPIGLKAYKPHHSIGEDFLHNYFGMLGIPIELVPEFPENESLIFLTESAAKDADILQKMKNQLLSGKNLVITSGLVSALEAKGFSDIAEIHVSTKKMLTDTFVMGWEPITYQAKKKVLVSQLMTLTNDVWEEVSCISGLAGTPLITSLRYGNGKLYILTIPDNFDDLYQLPVEVLDRIRKTLQPKGSQVLLQKAPEKVALMTYDNDTFVIASFVGEKVEATVVISEDYVKLMDLRSQEIIESTFLFEESHPNNDQKLVEKQNKQSIFKVTIDAQLFKAYKILRENE